MIGRLDALLERARVCKAETCRKPWSALHGAAVTSLSEALDPRYDGFYASRPRYVFGKCSESLYSAEEEGVPIVRLPDPKKLEEAKRRSKAWVAEKKTEGKMRVVGGQGRPFKMEPGMLLSKK